MTCNLNGRRIVLAIAALALASVAHAGSIAIFNTGVDASGNPLPDGTIGDPHYTLVSVPWQSSTIMVRDSTGGWPIPPWLGDNAFSTWLGPANDAQVDGPNGNYDYQTTFDLSALGTAASLTGGWAMDDLGVDILINGVSTGYTGSGSSGLSAFSINSGFVEGINTLDFIVWNGGGPTGLRVEIAGTASPEPASLGLFGIGFAGLFMLRRKLGWTSKLQ